MDKVFTPKDTIKYLDQYIIGQNEAKKAVAVALRNRWRRKQLPEELRQEVFPKNILMIGPTGVGKTEIARRLAKMADAPFIKVEASKFTEVGYVGRDVESMIRDLVRVAVNNLKEKKRKEVEEEAKKRAEERILDLLLPGTAFDENEVDDFFEDEDSEEVVAERQKREEEKKKFKNTREKFRKMFREGKFDDREVEYKVKKDAFPAIGMMSNVSFEEMGMDIAEMLEGFMPKKNKKTKMKVKDAYEHILEDEIERLIDTDAIAIEAKRDVEESGIVFIDEIDKIAGKQSASSGPDVSREGVQRDLLPIVEGSTVFTKYGFVKTDHILFIAAGAFNVSKPNDLIPELQGRFPIRVELNSLTEEDFIRILTEPKNSLIKQYTALLETESVKLHFTKGAIKKFASIAHTLNDEVEDIGARRLYTVMEHILGDISFEAPEKAGETVKIDEKYVDEKIGELVSNRDLNKYIL